MNGILVPRDDYPPLTPQTQSKWPLFWGCLALLGIIAGLIGLAIYTVVSIAAGLAAAGP